MWKMVGSSRETTDHVEVVFQAFLCMSLVRMSGDGALSLVVIVCLLAGSTDLLCPKQQLRGELLILMIDSRREAQVATGGTAEEIAASHTVKIMMPHKLCSAHHLGSFLSGHHVNCWLVREVE